jgi:hypothetical protein
VEQSCSSFRGSCQYLPINEIELSKHYLNNRLSCWISDKVKTIILLSIWFVEQLTRTNNTRPSNFRKLKKKNEDDVENAVKSPVNINFSSLENLASIFWTIMWRPEPWCARLQDLMSELWSGILSVYTIKSSSLASQPTSHSSKNLSRYISQGFAAFYGVWLYELLSYFAIYFLM